AADVDVEITRPVHNERRHANRWQDRTDVDLGVHLEECNRRSWAGGYTQVASPPVLQSRVVCHAWSQHVELRRAPPRPFDSLDIALALIGSRRPRIVRRADPFGICAVEDERGRPLRISSCETHDNVTTLLPSL